ncbi:MAG: HAD family hydrolase [Promethearchaeota archaeon]
MKFDYYLFDMDYCLVRYPDPEIIHVTDDIMVMVLKNLLEEIPDKEERDSFWKARPNFNIKLEKWGVENAEVFWKAYHYNDFVHRTNLVKSGQIRLYHDVKAVLINLQERDKIMGLVSNSPKLVVESFAKELGLSKLFQEIYGIDYDNEPDKAKPSPEGINEVLNKMGFNPLYSRAIMIGDSFNDILAAKRAKINACLIKRDPNKYSEGCDGWEYQPDFIIDQLIEILSI